MKTRRPLESVSFDSDTHDSDVKAVLAIGSQLLLSSMDSVRQLLNSDHVNGKLCPPAIQRSVEASGVSEIMKLFGELTRAAILIVEALKIRFIRRNRG